MQAKNELRRLPGAIVTAGRAPATLNRTESAFLAKLKADLWPFVGVGRLAFRLTNGAVYEPDFVTADENVIVAWSIGSAPRPDLLPVVSRPTVYFVSVERDEAGEWVQDDVVPMSDFLDLFAARPAIERARGGRMTDWDFRDWCLGIAREQRKRARSYMLAVA